MEKWTRQTDGQLELINSSETKEKGFIQCIDLWSEMVNEWFLVSSILVFLLWVDCNHFTKHLNKRQPHKLQCFALIPDHKRKQWRCSPQSSRRWACRRRSGRCAAALSQCRTQSRRWRPCPFPEGLVVLQVWPACTRDSPRSSPWPSEDGSWEKKTGELSKHTSGSNTICFIIGKLGQAFYWFEGLKVQALGDDSL